jgi:hypothetical protein
MGNDGVYWGMLRYDGVERDLMENEGVGEYDKV